MMPIVPFFLLLVVILISAKLAGWLLTRVGQPAVFGEILMGLILGPTLLNILHWGLFQPNSVELERAVHLLAEIGVILLMFLAGLETNLEEMKRVRHTAFWSALGGVILPLAGALILSLQFHYSWQESLFIGAILTATSVGISARTLMELNQLKSKEGTCILGAAVIDDFLGLMVLALVVALVFESGHRGGKDNLLIILQMLGFFVIPIWLGNRFLEPVTKMIARIPVRYVLLVFAVGVAILYAWLAENFGHIAGITGAYIAGVLFAKTPFGKEIKTGIHPLAYSVFVPIFFISIGLQANARELGQDWYFLVLLLIVGVLGKIIGCGLGARLTGFTNPESLRVGVGMISRGEVELIVAGYGLTHQIINQEIFSIMIIMVLFTTLITPLLLRGVFPKEAKVAFSSLKEEVKTRNKN